MEFPERLKAFERLDGLFIADPLPIHLVADSARFR